MRVRTWPLLGRIAALGLVGGCLTVAYHHVRGSMAAEIYSQRLRDLSADYERLHARYDEVVRRTAVTELVCDDQELSVVVRTADGVLKTIPTSLDPASEIHVQYIVLDGRLWIRSLLGLPDLDRTGIAEAQVVVIDPTLADLPWSQDPDLHGLSIFRKQLAPGRWVVSVTGNGALGLSKAKPGEVAELSALPPVRRFGEMDRAVKAELDDVGLADVIRHLLGRSRPWQG